MYSAAKSHVVSVLGPPPTRYAVHMTLELNRTASTAEQLNSLLTQIMENFSVSDHEGPLTDEVESAVTATQWWPAPTSASRAV